MNSTSNIKPTIWVCTPGICGGEDCVIGTRIRRKDIQEYRKMLGVKLTHQEVYPHLPIEYIEQA